MAGTGERSQSKAVPVIVGVVGLLLGIAAIVFAAGGDRSEMKRHGEDIKEHDGRIRALETGVTEMKTDVSWIRTYLETGKKPELPKS